MLSGFRSVKRIYFFQNIIIITGLKEKLWSIFFFFFLFFIIMILKWFLNLLTAFVTWSVAMKLLSLLLTMISRYFQVWNNIDEEFVKNFCYSLIFLRDNFFFDERYFRFCFYFISKKWLYRLSKGFVMRDVSRININKEIIFF